MCFCFNFYVKSVICYWTVIDYNWHIISTRCISVIMPPNNQGCGFSIGASVEGTEASSVSCLRGQTSRSWLQLVHITDKNRVSHSYISVKKWLCCQ